MWNIFPDQLEPLLLITLLSDVPCKQRDRWSERASAIDLDSKTLLLGLKGRLVSLDLLFLSRSF